MSICKACNGTGNAGHSAHIDEYGCLGCGGSGQTSWQHYALIVLTFAVIIAVLVVIS
jgi:DnaJ-class molecular chaperone